MIVFMTTEGLIMCTVNSELIARVVKQQQIIAKLDREYAIFQANSKEIDTLTQRVMHSDTKLFVINTISFH